MMLQGKLWATRLWAVVLCLVVTSTFGAADSALPLMTGFDEARVQSVYPPRTTEAVEDLSKLVFKLRQVDRRLLKQAVGPWPAPAVGEVVELGGEVTAVANLSVPPRLIEFLDMNRMQVIDLTHDETAVRIITTDLPLQAKVGDRVNATAMLVQPADASAGIKQTVLAAGSVSWFPQMAPSVGWQMLSQQGVDVSLLSTIASRSKMPLVAADGDAFYGMIAAAKNLAGQSDLAPPKSIEPVTLLKEADAYAGRWVQLSLETAQVTRVAVTDPERQKVIGNDHYYQIDAFGDLGDLIVQIEPASEDGEPAKFVNRFPVSLVCAELPTFLSDEIRRKEGGDAMVSEVRMQISIDGFFYRLWSYSTDFMRQHGGGEQFGPLLVASRFSNLESTEKDPAGVNVIGWVAALAVLVAILAIWVWNRNEARRDDEIRKKRRESEAENVQLPS